MDLNALELFAVAAETGSLSKAARHTGVPLPTLSRRVRKLEHELGVRLLDRGPRGLALTPAGSQLMADAAPALASLTQAKQRLLDTSGIAGTLRLSMPPHLEPIWRVLSEFGRRYPEVHFDVFVTDRRVDLVADGIDVTIRIGEGGFLSYVGRTLVRYRHQLVASPELLAQYTIEVPEDLQAVPCVCWRTAGLPVWTLGDQEVRLRPRLVTNDYLHLMSLAVSGEAITELPPFLANRGLRDGLLTRVLVDYPMLEQHVRALVVEKRFMSPLVRQFLDFASERVPDALANPQPA